MTAPVWQRDAESILLEWGSHWRARLEGCPLERKSQETVLYATEGDNKSEMDTLAVLHPRLTSEEARDAIKYAPMPRSRMVNPPTPGMVQIERDVSEACKRVGEALWLRFMSEELGIMEPEDVPNAHWRGKTEAILAVRFLIRETYVCKRPRRDWEPSQFDCWYPYSFKPKDRKSHGREATIRLVKSLL